MLLPSLLALSASAAATNLFIADYSGSITTAELSETNGSYALAATYENADCAPNPSWLTIDASHSLLYCMNEGLSSPNGSLSSFLINSDGSLQHVQNTTTANGPVSGIIYGSSGGPRGIVLAHYGGSAVSSWKIENDGTFTFIQNFFYTLDGPGFDPSRQDAPHEHEAITDPTGEFILVPDLGADVVRVYCWDAQSLELQELDSLKVTPGTGPRHAAFYTPSGVAGSTTYFYLVGELSADVTAYAVDYLPNGGGLSFNLLSSQPTIGPSDPPQRVAPAEIHVSPDNRFVVISNRNDTSFDLPDIGASDSLSTFALSDDGSLTFTQLAAAYGSYPRHYTINAAGNFVAVGLQNSDAVVILQRDVESGNIGEPVARLAIAGDVTNVVWNE